MILSAMMLSLLAAGALPLLASAQSLAGFRTLPGRGCNHNPSASRPDMHQADNKNEVSQLPFRRVWAPIQSWALHSHWELAKRATPLGSGSKVPKATASASARPSALQRSVPRLARGWHKGLRKTRCTTAVNARAFFRGCAMP